MILIGYCLLFKMPAQVSADYASQTAAIAACGTV